MTTTGSSTPVDDVAHARVPARNWFAVTAVAVGIFLLVTAEQLPIGLLVPVSTELNVSTGMAGMMVMVPGLVAAVSAPVVPLLAGRIDRRVLLGVLMALMTAGSVLSAAAPNFAVLFSARVLVGITIGGFWAVAGGLAVRLVPERAVGRATAVIFGGVAAANVFGVPLGTLVGDLAGWRAAFAGLGGAALIVVCCLFLLLPALPASAPLRAGALVAQWRSPGVRAVIIATFLIVIGHFAAYTYVSPVLQEIAGVSERLVSPLLFGFGAAGIIGNFIAGATVARSVRRTVLTISIALAAVMIAYPFIGGTAVTGIGLLVLWGLSYGGVSVSLQTWIIRTAPDSVEAASALWVCAFNLSIAVGALFGGVVVDSTSLSAVLWLGGAVVLLTVFAVLSTRKAELD